MTRRHWERLIWAGAVGALFLGARQTLRVARASDTQAIASTGQLPSADPTLVMFDSDVLDSVTAQTVAHDPFRAERKPANVAYSVASTGTVVPPVPAAPAARIELQGTIGGPPWQAIISGVPGHDGTVVVSAGDTLGGIAIRRVRRDSMTVRVKDSTWTVTLGKAGTQ